MRAQLAKLKVPVDRIVEKRHKHFWCRWRDASSVRFLKYLDAQRQVVISRHESTMPLIGPARKILPDHISFCRFLEAHVSAEFFLMKFWMVTDTSKPMSSPLGLPLESFGTSKMRTAVKLQRDNLSDSFGNGRKARFAFGKSGA